MNLSKENWIILKTYTGYPQRQIRTLLMIPMILSKLTITISHVKFRFCFFKFVLFTLIIMVKIHFLSPLSFFEERYRRPFIQVSSATIQRPLALLPTMIEDDIIANKRSHRVKFNAALSEWLWDLNASSNKSRQDFLSTVLHSSDDYVGNIIDVEEQRWKGNLQIGV